MRIFSRKDTQTSNVMSRRRFLSLISDFAIAFSLLASGGFGVATLVKYLQVPERDLEGRTKLGWIEVGSIGDFNEVPKRVDYSDEPVYIYFLKGKLVAFSAICPHMRCIVSWNHSNKPNPRTGTFTYNCPCHGSSFDLAGRRLFGPAHRGLYSQKLKVVNGKVFLGGGTPAT